MVPYNNLRAHEEYLVFSEEKEQTTQRSEVIDKQEKKTVKQTEHTKILTNKRQKHEKKKQRKFSH